MLLARGVSRLGPEVLLGLLVLELLLHRGSPDDGRNEEQDLLHGGPPSLAEEPAGIGIGGPNRT